MKLLIILLSVIKKHWISGTFFILTLITLLSLWPLSELPPVPGGDKTHHLIAYAVLMFPTAIKKPQYQGAIALGFVAWSGAIELLQPYVNRYGELQDMLANFAGIIMGWLLARLISVFCGKKK